MDKYKIVGKVVKAHNMKGEVFVGVFDIAYNFIQKIDEINFIKRGEALSAVEPKDFIKYTVKQARPHKVGKIPGFIFKFNEFSDRTTAEGLKGYQVVASSNEIKKENNIEFLLSEYIGYKVIDEVHEELGAVVSVNNNGFQDFVNIEYNSEIVSLPLLEPLLTSVDHKFNIIKVHLPQGYLD